MQFNLVNSQHTGSWVHSTAVSVQCYGDSLSIISNVSRISTENNAKFLEFFLIGQISIIQFGLFQTLKVEIVMKSKILGILRLMEN